MLRSQIVKGTMRVRSALEKLKFDEFSGDSTTTPQMLPKIFARYAAFMKDEDAFGETERTIMEILGLSELKEENIWAAMLMRSERKGVETLAQIARSVNTALKFLPKILELLKQDVDQFTESGKKEKENYEILSVTVIEDQQNSTPKRIVTAIESIDGLYQACATIMGEKNSDLSFLSCDSGSDKCFDFLGAAKIVSCVKEVLLSFWDRIVFFREEKTGRRLELIAESLPILGQIATMKDTGKLEPEQAELLKRQIIESIKKFAQAGVTIPEIDKSTVYNPRQLMQPERKLLTKGVQIEDPAKGEKKRIKRSKKEEGDLKDSQVIFEEMINKLKREKGKGKSGEAVKRPADINGEEEEDGE